MTPVIRFVFLFFFVIVRYIVLSACSGRPGSILELFAINVNYVAKWIALN